MPDSLSAHLQSRSDPLWRGIRVPKAAVVLAVSPVVAIALLAFNPWLCLAVLAAFALTGFLLRWPDLETLAVLFVLYANLAVVASKFHGVPQIFAGSFLLLLGLPLVNYLLIRREKIIVDCNGSRIARTPAGAVGR